MNNDFQSNHIFNFKVLDLCKDRIQSNLEIEKDFNEWFTAICNFKLHSLQWSLMDSNHTFNKKKQKDLKEIIKLSKLFLSNFEVAIVYPGFSRTQQSPDATFTATSRSRTENRHPEICDLLLRSRLIQLTTEMTFSMQPTLPSSGTLWAESVLR